MATSPKARFDQLEIAKRMRQARLDAGFPSVGGFVAKLRISVGAEASWASSARNSSTRTG